MVEREFYVQVAEDNLEDEQSQNTRVELVTRVTGNIVLASWTERRHFRTERQYRKNVSKEVESSLKFAGSIALAKPTSEST